MSSTFNVVMPSASKVAVAMEEAISVVAPSWPLDRQIAVNPYWGFIDRTFDETATTLAHLMGARFTFDRSEILRAWNAGEITRQALRCALAEKGSAMTVDSAVSGLHAPGGFFPGFALLSDILDEQATPGSAPRWSDTITQQVSQYCASYFDEHQADWHRGRTVGLFNGWRAGLQSDHAIEPLMHAPQIRARVLHGNSNTTLIH